ncbi:hypothetical protein BSL78_25744 [Apostichopus japonicus]|uniref:Uncharacterized protein n=1 Tax=Stichopus japonicus TaxID=307972 RepID=A0A2G8JNY3_STIJA|nr:hypothetical protein BSL78_25744 [Apostichopus japonicus]
MRSPVRFPADSNVCRLARVLFNNNFLTWTLNGCVPRDWLRSACESTSLHGFFREFLLPGRSHIHTYIHTSQWWDDVKLRIKRYAIQYCVTRARRRREKFSKLCAEVKFGDPSAVIALQTYLDEKYHGARVRARVEAVEAEERPSLRFYQSVSSSAVTDASRLCALRWDRG